MKTRQARKIIKSILTDKRWYQRNHPYKEYQWKKASKVVGVRLNRLMEYYELLKTTSV